MSPDTPSLCSLGEYLSVIGKMSRSHVSADCRTPRRTATVSWAFVLSLSMADVVGFILHFAGEKRFSLATHSEPALASNAGINTAYTLQLIE